MVEKIPTVLVERGGKLADEFKGGAEFVTLEFEPETGKSCSEYPTTKVKEQVAAEVINLANGNVELNFPEPELAGNTLEAFGLPAKLVGKATEELENGWAFRAM